MKVRMLSTAAGPDGVWPEMSKQDLPVVVALDLIRRGHAVGLEFANASPVTELAVTGTAEVAAVDPAEEKAILTPVEVAGKRKKKPASSDQ